MEWNHRKEFCLPLTFIPLSICLIQKWRNLNFSRDFLISTAKFFHETTLLFSCKKICFLELDLLCWAFLKCGCFLPLVHLLTVNLATKLQRPLWSQVCAIYEWCYIWIDILRKFSKDFLRTLQRVSGSTTTQNGLIHFKGL